MASDTTMTTSISLSGGRLAAQLGRAERRKKLRALSLTLPLLAFLVAFFLVPLGSLLIRAVENPEVADALPRTGQALSGWDRKSEPPVEAYAALLDDFTAFKETADAGALARRLNSEVAGARSLVMGTYRALPFTETEGEKLSAEAARTKLLEHDERWGQLPY